MTTDTITRTHEILDRGLGLDRRSLTVTEHENGSVCMTLEDGHSIAVVELESAELQRLAGEIIEIAEPNGGTAAKATAQFNEALRLITVAGQHRAQMMREVDDPDVKRQRGNAASVAHCEGVALGIAACLRAFGYDAYADRIEHAADHGVDSVQRDDPAGDRDTLQERANELNSRDDRGPELQDDELDVHHEEA